MRKLHYFSGIILSVFIFLHLINHIASVVSIQTHILWMEKFRVYYRNPLIEILLLLCLIFQIFTGIKLYFLKRKSATTFFQKLQLFSGLYLAVFFVIHVSAVLVGRYLLNLDTNFYFGVAGLNTFPFNMFFIPYYSLAILMFFSHIASIHNSKMKSNILGITVSHQSFLIILIGILFTIIIMYGLTGKFNGVQIPVEYGVLVGK